LLSIFTTFWNYTQFCLCAQVEVTANLYNVPSARVPEINLKA